MLYAWLSSSTVDNVLRRDSFALCLYKIKSILLSEDLSRYREADQSSNYDIISL